MADDEQPTPADQPAPKSTPAATPRGAGFDDDEWVRRDLGPRPEVPNHGRRPVLIGIPILLITIAAVVAILIAGCGGDDEPSTAAGSTPSAAPADASTEKVTTAVRAAGKDLAGRGEASAFADATCEPTDGADYRCAFGGDGDPDAGAIRVRLQDDGSVTKLLGTAPPTAEPKTSTATQTLLADDDVASGATTVKYTCATSTAINPDGTSAGSSATGQRCVLIDAKGKVVGQRYVEFSPDGSVRRDFMVTT